MKDLNKQLKNLPHSPGVYFFKNKTGGIIYIGKASNLKNRVSSYFYKKTKFFNAAKIKMLSEIANIEILKTASEIKALIKESELIKKHKPKFNILMRDSKNYLFVGFTTNEFPKIILTHQPNGYQLKAKSYLGPFTDANALKKTLRLLRDIFPYCTCKQKHNIKCLNAHMGRCFGTCCLKLITSEEKIAAQKTYQKNIRAIKKIITGHSYQILRALQKELKNKTQSQNFEQALKLRNQILALKEVLAHAHVLDQKTTSSPAIFQDIKPNFKALGFRHEPKRIETYDVSHIQGQNSVGSMVVFERQTDGSYGARKNQYRKFKIKTVSSINDPAMIAEIIKRRLAHLDWNKPQLIIVDGGRTQLNAALKVVGLKKIRVVALAKKLEEIYLSERKDPLSAQSLGQSLKHLFQAIRDEAHRFAITYHRQLHQKTYTLSFRGPTSKESGQG